MVIKIKRTKAKVARGKFNDLPLLVKYRVSEVSGNLFFTGEYDGEQMQGFIWRGAKRGEIGGNMIECDAIRKRDRHDFAVRVASVCKYNKVKG